MAKLGTGFLERARKGMKERTKKIDKAVEEASKGRKQDRKK